MTTVKRTVDIDAPVDRIWGILSELDQYPEWETGYASSEYVSEQRTGVGAVRRVGLRSPMGVRRAVHVVTRWDEPNAIAWEARDTNFPLLKSAEQTVTLRPEGDGARVENTVVYELKYGPLGGIMDPLMFRRVVRGAAEGFLSSLAARSRGS